MHRRTGFTLIEMLVVIALMIFLASLTFWGLQSARRHIRISTTRSIVGRMDTAIREFYAQYLEYPPTPAEMPAKAGAWGLDAGTTWYDFMNHAYQNAKDKGQPKFEARGPRLTIEKRFIDQTNGDIIDIWGNPIIVEIDAVTKSVLVYSFGEDEENDEGHYTGDGCPEADHGGYDEPVDDISTR